MYITKKTKKGQITIPAKYRKNFNVEYFSVEMKDNQLIIKPVKSLAGSLKKYAKKGKNVEKIMEEEKNSFTEVLVEKHSSF